MTSFVLYSLGMLYLGGCACMIGIVGRPAAIDKLIAARVQLGSSEHRAFLQVLGFFALAVLLWPFRFHHARRFL